MKPKFLFFALLAIGLASGCIGPGKPPTNGTLPKVSEVSPPNDLAEARQQIAELRQKLAKSKEEHLKTIDDLQKCKQAQLDKIKVDLTKLEKEKVNTAGLSDDEIRQKIKDLDALIAFLRGEIDALLQEIAALTTYYRETEAEK